LLRPGPKNTGLGKLKKTGGKKSLCDVPIQGRQKKKARNLRGRLERHALHEKGGQEEKITQLREPSRRVQSKVNGRCHGGVHSTSADPGELRGEKEKPQKGLINEELGSWGATRSKGGVPVEKPGGNPLFETLQTKRKEISPIKPRQIVEGLL